MIIILASGVVALAVMLYKMTQWRYLPPGPWGLPVLGYLPFLDRKYPHLSLSALSSKYGGIYSVGMGSVMTVVLSDHKLVREAFAKDAFSGRAPLYLTHGIMEGNGIICAEGALWKDQRKLVTSWLKNMTRSAGRQEVDGKIADGIKQLFEDIKTNGINAMDLSNMITNTLGNLVNDLVFGYTFPPKDPTWQWLRQVQEEGCHEMSVAGTVNFLPFIRFFSGSVKKTMSFIKNGQEQTHKVYARIVARRRSLLNMEAPKGSEDERHVNMNIEQPDGLVKCIKYSKQSPSAEEHFFDPEVLKASTGECVLDSFLEEQKNRFDAKEESAVFTSDKQMMYLLADLFGAGLDTTSVTLSWFMLFMALHQDEQDIVRKEILEQYPKGNNEVIEGARLPRLMAALCEAQRLRSIVPVGIPHGCVEKCDIGGYTIPKGTMVIALQWALHMDPAIWKDPEVFKPSRFVGSDGNLLKPQEFIPFQTGKRMCPGDELSRILSAGLMARLLASWRVRVQQQPDDMRGEVGVTLGPPRVLFYCDAL